jgi:hypothetical protein
VGVEHLAAVVLWVINFIVDPFLTLREMRNDDRKKKDEAAASPPVSPPPAS